MTPCVGTRRMSRPTGWRRILFRLPVHLYRWGFGWLLGQRFVAIHHRGRRTGAAHTTVVEVAARDRDADTWTVASGWGPEADWYRNLLAQPDVVIQVGRRWIPVHAEPLPADDGADVMTGYARRHPRTARRIAGLLGFAVDGSEADLRTVGRELPFIRFSPRP